MVDTNIDPIGCSREYGNPSGHAIYSGGYFVFVFLDIFHGEYSYQTVNKTFYFVSLFATASIAFLIMFDRLYTGLHSLNQIIYGF